MPEPGLHEGGHRGLAPRRFFPQALHHGIVDVESRLHMENRIIADATCQFPFYQLYRKAFFDHS